MKFFQVLFGTVAYLSCSTNALVLPEPQDNALYHGSFSNHDGNLLRYRQLAEGMFTAVPAHEWDDNVHTQGNETWNLEHLAKDLQRRFESPSLQSELAVRGKDLETLEDRNLEDVCKVIGNCIAAGGRWTLEKGSWAWLAAAEKAAEMDKGKALSDFLGSSFVANLGGVTIAGRIINGSPAKARDCSTKADEKDAIYAAVNAFVDSHKDANSVKIDIDPKPGGGWSIELSASAPETTPAPPQCP